MNAKLILEDDIRDGDAAAHHSSVLEQLALRAELARREQVMRPTTWVLTYHIPGTTVVRVFLDNATRVDVMVRLDEEIGLRLAIRGHTIRDVTKATCPVHVAFARYSSTGEITAEGNWPELMRAATRCLGEYMAARTVSGKLLNG